PEVDARSLAERRTGPLDVRKDVLDRAALGGGAVLDAPDHERGGVNTGALAPVGGGKAMVGGGTKDEAIRGHNSVHAPAEFEAPTGCHEHPSNGWYMIIPAFIDHFFDEGVPAFFAVAFGILPNFVNSPLRVMVVMRPAGKSSPSGPLDRYLIRKEHAP